MAPQIGMDSCPFVVCQSANSEWNIKTHTVLNVSMKRRWCDLTPVAGAGHKQSLCTVRAVGAYGPTNRHNGGRDGVEFLSWPSILYTGYLTG